MISLLKILFETGPSAQGLGSYDDRMGIESSLDFSEEAGLLDLYDNIGLDSKEEVDDRENFQTAEKIRVKSTP